VTNKQEVAAFLARFGKQGRFMRPALEALDLLGLRHFFNQEGVDTHTLDGFHVFPVSESAQEVRDALVEAARRAGVRFFSRTKVTGLLMEGGELRGVLTDAGPLPAGRVLLTTGGRSYSQLGATGIGYRLARDAGHTVKEPVPALVPLVTEEPWPATCTGIVLQGVRIRIDLPRQSKQGVSGDLLFTHRGISGPAPLDISGDVADLLQERLTVPLRVSIFADGASEGEWLGRLQGWQSNHGGRMVHTLLGERLPNALARVLCEQAGCAPDQRAAQLARGQRQALARLLAETPLTVTGTEGFGKAIVTRGGGNLREVNPGTLESRLVKGL
jgi:predicted Rossmann fold flavoprotein